MQAHFLRSSSCALVLASILAACTPSVGLGTGGSGGAGGHAAVTSSTTTTGSGTATSSSTGTPMCSTGCVDGNPCTDGACVAGMCQQTNKAVGAVGNADEGACVGVCQSDGQCGLSLYSRVFPGSGSWTSQPLSAAWTGANAPPPRGILAAEHPYQQDRIYVWADDGKVYRHEGGAWLTPVATSTMFPGLGATNVRGTTMWQFNATPVEITLLVTTTAPGTTPRQAFTYTLDQSDGVTPDPGNPETIMSTVSMGGPPQDTTDVDWSFPVQTAYVGTPSWLVFWEHVGTKVYEWNAGNNAYMGSWDDAQSPLWAGGGTPPAPDSVVAAYYTQGTAYLVAP